MKVKIIRWKPMTWQWLNREALEGRELEVLELTESPVHKGKMSYLLKESAKYVLVRDCEVVNE